MNNLDTYKKAVSILDNNENLALITVISTKGSSPGKVGYKMLLWGKEFNTFGTVGGGLVEAEIINIAKNILPKIESRAVMFQLKENLEDAKGVCGGAIELLIETFDKKNQPLFLELSNAVENREKGVLISIISPGNLSEKKFMKKIDQINSITGNKFSSETIEAIKKIADKESPSKILQKEMEIFVEPLFDQPKLFIFGGGHICYYMSKYLKFLNFSLTVCDYRDEFANEIRFPDADNIIVGNFENIFDKVDIDKGSYVVLVTSGHKFDVIILENIVKTDAKYIGMIGSKRKALTVIRKLKLKGIPEEKLKRIFSPIGISIGAVTPEEIALSIVCELIKITRLGSTPQIDHMKMNL